MIGWYGWFSAFDSVLIKLERFTVHLSDKNYLMIILETGSEKIAYYIRINGCSLFDSNKIYDSFKFGYNELYF